jgi:thiamine-phosphate pyrophosphorylase
MKPFFYGEKMQFTNYLITDPKYYSDDNTKFKEVLSKALSNHQIFMASFRDKISDDVEPLAKSFVDICKANNVPKVLINSNIELALSLGYDGVHLTSKQFDKIKYCKDNKLYVVISCHDFEEAKKAYDLGADAITYSPIFYTPYKGKPKGIEALKALKNSMDEISKRDFKIIGLGGIVDIDHINQIKHSGANGFASIRYFID